MVELPELPNCEKLEYEEFLWTFDELCRPYNRFNLTQLNGCDKRETTTEGYMCPLCNYKYCNIRSFYIIHENGAFDFFKSTYANGSVLF